MPRPRQSGARLAFGLAAMLLKFLLTLAVVDDLGTIAVIAIFFSAGISLAWLAGAAGLTLAVAVFQRMV